MNRRGFLRVMSAAALAPALPEANQVTLLGAPVKTVPALSPAAASLSVYRFGPPVPMTRELLDDVVFAIPSQFRNRRAWVTP